MMRVLSQISLNLSALKISKKKPFCRIFATAGRSQAMCCAAVATIRPATCNDEEDGATVYEYRSYNRLQYVHTS